MTRTFPADHILIGRTWQTDLVHESDLTERQQYALATHRKYLEEGAPLLLALGFYQEHGTMIQRGQPITAFVAHAGYRSRVRIELTGLGHWKFWQDGAALPGTRDVSKLDKLAAAAIAGDES